MCKIKRYFFIIFFQKDPAQVGWILNFFGSFSYFSSTFLGHKTYIAQFLNNIKLNF